MRVTRVIAGAALLGVASAGTLRGAVVTKNFYNLCRVGTLRTCASIRVETDFDGTNTHVKLYVRNLQGSPIWGSQVDNTGGSIITKIGLVAPSIGLPTGGLNVTTSGSVDVQGAPASGWKMRNPGYINTQIELDAETKNGYTAGIMGCDPSASAQTVYFRTCDPTYTGWVVFSFTTVGGGWDASQTQVAFMSGDYANPPLGSPQGTECDSQGGTGGRVACESVVPEPVTMLLLGTGLASMGGVGLVRRRRGHDVKNV